MRMLRRNFALLLLTVVVPMQATAGNLELSPNQLKLVKFVLNEDLENFIDGKASSSFGDLPLTTAQEAAQDYEDNEVAGDQKFFRKMTRITGRIYAIRSGLGNRPYVELQAANVYLSPQLRFRLGNDLKIAKLKKGERLTAVCQGNGAVLGRAMFSDCMMAADFANAHVEQTMRDIPPFLAGGRAKSPEVVAAVGGAIALSKVLPASSPCFTGEGSCRTDVSKILSSNKLDQAVVQAWQEMRAKGLTVPSKLEK